MTFNLIGLGLTENSITAEELSQLKTSNKIYLENYTINFPYSIKELEKIINNQIKNFGKSIVSENSNTNIGCLSTKSKLEVGNLISKKYQNSKTFKTNKIKIIPLNRRQVESEEILNNAKKQNISLLVYGDPLSATTHLQLIQTCKNKKIPYKISHNASILTAISETGLSLYKFGKTTSMPDWSQHKHKPTSFIDIIKQNQSIQAHTLILIDIGLEIKYAKQQLKQSAKKNNLALDLNKEKLILISKAGTEKQKIIYKTLKSMPDKIPKPYCLIIPSKLNLAEQEFLEKL